MSAENDAPPRGITHRLVSGVGRLVFGRLLKRPIIWIEQKLQRNVNLGPNRLLRFNRWRCSFGITTSIGSNGNIVKYSTARIMKDENSTKNVDKPPVAVSSTDWLDVSDRYCIVDDKQLPCPRWVISKWWILLLLAALVWVFLQCDLRRPPPLEGATAALRWSEWLEEGTRIWNVKSAAQGRSKTTR